MGNVPNVAKNVLTCNGQVTFATTVWRNATTPVTPTVFATTVVDLLLKKKRVHAITFMLMVFAIFASLNMKIWQIQAKPTTLPKEPCQHHLTHLS